LRAAVLVSRLRDATALLRVRIITRWAHAKRAIVVGLRFWDDVRHAAVWLRLWWNGLKRTWLRIVVILFMTVVSILVILAMTVVIVAAGHWMWGVWHSWQLADAASVTTTWPTNTILSNVTVEVKTKCRDSQLSYVVALVPPKSSAPLTRGERTDRAKIMTDEVRERLKAIELQLVDKEGFRIAAFDLVTDNFIRIYSTDDERLVILEARGTLPCSPARYLRAEEVIVSWTERP
jgi:hypothetical protein